MPRAVQSAVSCEALTRNRKEAVVRQFLITSVAIAGLTTFATSVLADEKNDGEAKFVETFKMCIKRHVEKSPKAAECYLLEDLRYWCPREVDKTIPDGCTKEANDSARPARRAGY